MNKFIKKFLLTGDKFMPELHLKQLGFTYSACGPLLNTVKKFKTLEKQVIQNIYIEMNQTKLVFAHDAAYYNSKNLGNRTFQIKF